MRSEQRGPEVHEEVVALTTEEIEAVSGGVLRFVRAIFYSGTNTGDSMTSTNPQAWVQTST